MKKLVVLAVLVLGGLALSSCNRNACPAFSQAEVQQPAARA